MTREQFERFVEAVEIQTRSDLIEFAGMWRQDVDRHKATYEEGLHRESATEAAPNKAAWVSPNPRQLFHLPLDLAVGFVEVARHVLSGDEKSLDRAFGLTRPPGRPVDPNKSTNFDLAENALVLRMLGKSWTEVNEEVFADRAEPPDERYIRTIVARYKPLIMEKWRRELQQRWLARSEQRRQESILKNAQKGKSRTANSG